MGALQAGGGATSAGASLDFWFIDPASGGPLVSLTGQEICNPCTSNLDETSRAQLVDLWGPANDVGGLASDPEQPIFVGTLGGKGADDAFAVLETVDFATGVRRATLPAKTGGKTLVLPQILEVSGTIQDTQNTFDTTLFVSYVGGLGDNPDNGGATVNLYLFDEVAGTPLQSATAADVCNPCTATLGTGAIGDPEPRRVAFVFDDLVTDAGGFVNSAGVVLGFAILTVEGDTDGVSAMAYVTNARTGPTDITVFSLPAQELTAPPE